MRVTELGSRQGEQVVGREPELALLERFLDSAPGRLLLTGGPGAGKTTIWEAALDAARRRRLRILVARPSGAETQLAFAGLADLLDEVDGGDLDGLPPPQRHALEVALLRADPEGAQLGPRAVAAGLLSALRELAAREPVLIAIDDVQWLDAPSADALAFAARRLRSDDVTFLLVRRSGTVSALVQELEPIGLERLAVAPLSLGAAGRILVEQLGLRLPRRVVRQIFESTGGNPLFVLEVGRTLLEREPPRIGEQIPVPDRVEDLLGTRVEQLSPPVRRLLLALALSGELRARQLAGLGDVSSLDTAVSEGLIVVDDDRPRAAHPLLAATALQRSTAAERRALHLELADLLATDGELRARHLALAADRPDERLAATIAAAAARASDRGAAPEAVILGEHALRLTPPDAPERAARVIALAEYLVVAGELDRVESLLVPEFEALPPGAARVRACRLMCEAVATVDESTRLLERALDECGDDPTLHALILAEMATDRAVLRVEQIAAAEATALAGLPAARATGPEAERDVLQALAWGRSLRGRQIDDLCRQFDDVSDATYFLAASPHRIAGQRLVWRGETARAKDVFARLIALADERGESLSYVLYRLHVCENHLRAGEWDAAAEVMDDWEQSGDRRLLFAPMYERCRALLAAGRGHAEEAERWAAETIARAETTGVRWDELEARRARGIAALLAHEPERAAESLRIVWEQTEREGVEEPGVFPVAPDLVEALAELGAADEGAAVTARLTELAEALEHPWGLATAKRCRSVVRLDAKRYEQEAAALNDAAADYEALGLRFDHGRTLLTLGRGQRRLRKWGDARRTLEQAITVFEEIGSSGWVESARSELSRVGARRPTPAGELTPTERRIAELAAEGLANKEIARTLVVTVHTVEVHLSHAYAKLGIRSRSQLAARLAGSG